MHKDSVKPKTNLSRILSRPQTLSSIEERVDAIPRITESTETNGSTNDAERSTVTKIQLPTFDTNDFDLDELTRQTIETTRSQDDSDDGENSIHMSPIEAERAQESFMQYDPETDHIRRVKQLTLCLDKVKESLLDITDTPTKQ